MRRHKKLFFKNVTVHQRRIENKLKKYFLSGAPFFRNELHQAMIYSVFNGGKRLRPLLVYGVGHMFGANWQKLDRAAMAVECIHTFSLIHDDLPAIDNDDYRRGKLSCHKKFSESTAILAGDALQSLGFEILALNQNIDQIKLLANAIGGHGMALGQAQDIAYQKSKHHKNFTLSRKKLYAMHQLKTGKLMMTSLLLGALCQKDLPSRQMFNHLKTFGEYFGLGFQLLDDFLDNENNIQMHCVQEVFNKARDILQWFKSKNCSTVLLEEVTAYLLDAVSPSSYSSGS